ncbi:MAG: hypothetical protein ACOYJ1_05815 [Peptococcales bacterium]
MEKISIREIESLPPFLTAKELNEKILHLSQVKLYELLGQEKCPKILIGKKYLIPTRKFIEYLENLSTKN